MLPQDPWPRLVEEGKFNLINKLARAQKHEPGFGTIVIPKEGFSDNDKTHNMVLDWLSYNKIRTLNVLHEVTLLERALHGCKSLD